MKNISNLLMKSYQTLKDISDNCTKCEDGYISVQHKSGATVAKECEECTPYRQIIAKIQRSGIESNIDKYMPDNYKTPEEWQKPIKKTAAEYCKAIQDGGNSWLYIGGQRGSGKTLLSGITARTLLYSNFRVQFIKWRTEAKKLKRLVNDEKYDYLLSELLKVQILAIDDLFKGSATEADINLAYDIIDGRYENNKPLIITSENNINDIMKIDEAIGGRIIEKATRRFIIDIDKDSQKDYRLKKK